MISFCLIALGCPKAHVEAEATVGRLLAAGMRLVDDPDGADAAVVHTCAFVEDARIESLGTIETLAELRRIGRLGRLVVVGCLPQRYGGAVTGAVPEIDAVVGVNDLDRVVDAVRGRDGPMLRERPDPSERRVQPRAPWGATHVRYLKIAEGCSRRCAFCAIPAIRGEGRSRPQRTLLDEARMLVDEGAVEIVLVAQDVSRYGADGGGSRPGLPLLRLTERLARIERLRWIRLLYLYPDAVSGDFLRGVAANPKIVPYLDLPMQHATDRMLRIMRRGTTRRDLDAAIDRIRTILPGATIRSTFLVGHPGETERDYLELERFVRKAGIDRIGLFRYSDEEGTAAFGLTGKVAPSVSYRRFRRLGSVARRVMADRQRGLRGRVVEVLVDSPAPETPLLRIGRTAAQAPEVDGVTYLVNGLPPAGAIVAARITRTSHADLVADLEWA